MNYKTSITLLIILATGFILSAFMPQQQDFKAKNLKVLPKDISKDEIEKVMEDFKVALGVKCSFCHAAQPNDPKKLDFASDEKHEKEIARKMMRMTTKLNKKYFHNKRDNGVLRNISCKTCHNGSKEPYTIEIN